MSYAVVKLKHCYGVEDKREHRVLSPRFRSEESAIKFVEMIETAEPTDNSFVTIAQVARELTIEPFRARAILRKLGMTPESGRWKIPAQSPEHNFIRSLLIKFKKTKR